MDIQKHSDWFNPSVFEKQIHIIGVGAIGSNVAEQLARLGFTNINLYDFDTVEPHNITNQIYTTKDLYESKILATAKRLRAINPEISLVLNPHGWKQGMDITGIIILAVDSIELRKEIVEEYQYDPLVEFITDMRIGLEEAQMYAATPEHFDRLLSNMEFTHDEVKVPVSACGTQLTVLPTVHMIVSVGVMNLIRFIKDKEYNAQTIINSLTGQAQSIKNK